MNLKPAHYECPVCGCEYTDKAGLTKCPMCGSIYIKWKNFEEFEKKT